MSSENKRESPELPMHWEKNTQKRIKDRKKMSPLIQFHNMYLQRSSKEKNIEKNESISTISRYVSTNQIKRVSKKNVNKFCNN